MYPGLPSGPSPILGNRPGMLPMLQGGFQNRPSNNMFQNLLGGMQQPQGGIPTQGPNAAMGMESDPFLESNPYMNAGWGTQDPQTGVQQAQDQGFGEHQNLAQMRNALTRMHVGQAMNRMRKHQVAHANSTPY